MFRIKTFIGLPVSPGFNHKIELRASLVAVEIGNYQRGSRLQPFADLVENILLGAGLPVFAIGEEVHDQ